MSGNRHGYSEGIGRWTPGNVISDADGKLTSTETGQPVAPPDGPAPKTEAKPATAPEPSEADRELDAELAAKTAALRKLGATEEEILRHTGSPAQPAPAVTLASIEKELAKIAETRRTDSRSYWRDEALQQKERDLIGLQLKLQAGGNAETAETEGTEATGEADEPSDAEAKLAALQDELAEVQAKRKDAKGAERDKLDARELVLLREFEVTSVGALLESDIAEPMIERWSGAGGTDDRINTLAGYAQSLYSSMTEPEAMAFAADLKALPVAVRVELYDAMSVEGGAGLTARREAVLGALSGAAKAAAESFWKKHGEAITRGLVG
jgi:hypothetical protein